MSRLYQFADLTIAAQLAPGSTGGFVAAVSAWDVLMARFPWFGTLH